MTATYAYDDEPPTGHPLLPGASPHAIRAGLLPEDRDNFDAEYQQSLADARESLDLSGLFRTLDHWRRVALLQRDPTNFRRIVRRAAELLTGEAVPEEEPLAVTRAKVGM